MVSHKYRSHSLGLAMQSRSATCSHGRAYRSIHCRANHIGPAGIMVTYPAGPEAQQLHPVVRGASEWQFRQYDHAEDRLKITEMCADVYGGTDYMPRMLEHYSHDPESVLMLVAEHCQDQSLGGIICGDIRGDIVFLFGLRVSSQRRGRGLGRVLTDVIIEHCRAKFPRARAVFTATIPQNLAAVALFTKCLGPEPVRRFEHWPTWDAMTKYEQSFGWPGTQAGPDNCLLQAIDGVMDTLQGDLGAMQQVSQWRPAASQDEAAAAVMHIKRHGLSESTHPLLMDPWFPGKYEVHPVQSPIVAGAASEGKLWVLKDPQETRYLGVLMVYYSLEGRRQVASIVAADPSAVHSALLVVAKRIVPHKPHFVAFVERGPCCDQPAVYQHSLPRTCMVFGRLMEDLSASQES